MPKLIVRNENKSRHRLDPRNIKSPCCQHATQPVYGRTLLDREDIVVTCLKCDELWVYRVQPTVLEELVGRK